MLANYKLLRCFLKVRKYLMEKIFDINGKVYKVLARAGDLFILNMLFILSCLPVITIGVACSSLYAVMLKLWQQEEAYIIKDYVKAFKRDFKQSTIVMFILLFVAVIFYIVIRFLHALVVSPIILLPILILFSFFVLMSLYLFPLIAKFEDSILQQFKNAIYLSLKHMSLSVVIFLITIVILVLFPVFVFQLSFLWFVFGIALAFYLNAHLFNYIFQQYI